MRVKVLDERIGKDFTLRMRDVGRKRNIGRWLVYILRTRSRSESEVLEDGYQDGIATIVDD